MKIFTSKKPYIHLNRTDNESLECSFKNLITEKNVNRATSFIDRLNNGQRHAYKIEKSFKYVFMLNYEFITF